MNTLPREQIMDDPERDAREEAAYYAAYTEEWMRKLHREESERGLIGTPAKDRHG